MNFHQLEYALAVDRTKHFGRAAESCNVTQATLSAMIKKLEDELSIQLFDRSRHPITTTEEGLIVLQKAKEILVKQQELFQINFQGNEILKGVLRLGIIPTISNTLLPLILPHIIKQYPDLKLIISEITTEQILHQLSHNQIDLGILSTPIEGMDEMFEESILYYEAMMIYGISEGSKAFVSSKDVQNKKVWLLEEGHCFRSQSMTLCNIQENKENSENLAFKSNSFETLINLSDRMGGLTLIPELYYKSLSDERKQKTRGFQSPIPVREVSLLALKPLVKRQSMMGLSKLIKSLIVPQLLTQNYKNNELNIIGI